MVWKSRRKATLDWRAYLTKDEAAIIGESDRLKERLKELAPHVRHIANRAIHRAKYEFLKRHKGKE